MNNQTNVYLVFPRGGGNRVLMVQAESAHTASNFWDGEEQLTLQVDELPVSGYAISGNIQAAPGILGEFNGNCTFQGAVVTSKYFVYIPAGKAPTADGLSLLQQAELGVQS